MVIYANQLLRSAYPAMLATALVDPRRIQRSAECDKPHDADQARSSN
jgi:hypothetical protein